MGGTESRGGGLDERDRLCGQCSDGVVYQQSFCVKRAQLRRSGDVEHPTHISISPSSHQSSGDDLIMTSRDPSYPDIVSEDTGGSPYFTQQEVPDSWRFHANTEESVGVGAYFGRLEGQKDSVARVKSLVSGGPAEQTGMIEVLHLPNSFVTIATNKIKLHLHRLFVPSIPSFSTLIIPN